MKIIHSIFLAPLVMGACTSPPPAAAPPLAQSSPVPTTNLSLEGPGPDPVLVAVAAVRPPAKVSIDGDLAEWGPPDLRGSKLVFALDQRALLIAAELGEGAKEGIWLGLATTPPEVHGIGQGWVNGAIEEIDCEQGGHLDNGRWTPDEKGATPESKAACKALLDQHKVLTDRHQKRFSRMFRIDREGVRERKEKGELVSIAGASAQWKPSATGVKVEVSLPLLALPRVTEAPLRWLGAWARAGSTAPTEPTAEEVKVPLPEPVSFEPYGELRAHVLKENKHQVKWNIQYATAGQSYQPGDPLHIESMQYDGPTKVVLREGTLYEKAASLGDVEVGYVHAFHEYLAIFKGGKLLSMVEPRPACSSGIGKEDTCACDWEASWEGVIAREGAIHAFLHHKGGGPTLSCGMEGAHAGGWSVLVIAPDGTHHEAEEAPPHPEFLCERQSCFCQKGSKVANKTLDSFSWSGDCLVASKDNTGLELSKRWDSAKKKYVTSWRRVPPTPKKQP